jgi:ubiquinone/menaquinone biosynthesis C-methylase UbiE
MDSAGKRAAFALFYGPLHAMCISQVVTHLRARIPEHLLDIGCGTGAAGAGWALSADTAPRISGIDRNRWAVDEARWTYRTLGVDGNARVADLKRLPVVQKNGGILAAYVLNELPDAGREAVTNQMLDAADRGTGILIVEPIARSITPWWDQAVKRFTPVGGRADEWRFAVTLPSLLVKFDRAAGLRHHELTCRTISVNL